MLQHAHRIHSYMPSCKQTTIISLTNGLDLGLLPYILMYKSHLCISHTQVIFVWLTAVTGFECDKLRCYSSPIKDAGCKIHVALTNVAPPSEQHQSVRMCRHLYDTLLLLWDSEVVNRVESRWAIIKWSANILHLKVCFDKKPSNFALNPFVGHIWQI